MSSSADNSPSNEELVAYLDGELDAGARLALDARLARDGALRDRLDRLRMDQHEFAAAFDRLFDAAPADRLAAMLARVEAESAAKPAAAKAGNWRILQLIAAGLVLFLIGGAVGYLAGTGKGSDEIAEVTPGYWRQVVAEYVSLYSPETFAGFPDDRAIQTVALAAVGKPLGLTLTPDNVALPGLTLKGPVLFKFRDMPLAQVGYLSKNYGPVAFCMIVNGQPDKGPTFETREGKNIVYWQKGGRGYLVIGTAPRDQLEAYAERLERDVS
jgi:anti-sigma factor RsiW